VDAKYGIFEKGVFFEMAYCILPILTLNGNWIPFFPEIFPHMCKDLSL